MKSRIECSVRKYIVFPHLTDFLDILIHPFWFYAFVEKFTTILEAVDHFRLSIKSAQRETCEQKQKKHFFAVCLSMSMSLSMSSLLLIHRMYFGEGGLGVTLDKRGTNLGPEVYLGNCQEL